MLRDMASARLRLAQDRKASRDERGRAAALKDELATQQASVERKLASAKRLLAGLEAEQRARLAAERRRATLSAIGDRASRGGDRTPVPSYSGPASGRAAEAVKTAYAQLGDPYAWGAAGPGAFDCSGLTMYSWARGRRLAAALVGGAVLRRAARLDERAAAGRPGLLLQPDQPRRHLHRRRQVIDAPYPGLSVHITGLHSMPFTGAGRP